MASASLTPTGSVYPREMNTRPENHNAPRPTNLLIFCSKTNLRISHDANFTGMNRIGFGRENVFE
jgi:hypothetical protein